MYQQMEVLIIDSRAPLLLLGGTLPRVDGYFFREKKELRTNVLNYFDEALCSTLRRYREEESVQRYIDTNVYRNRRKKKGMKINIQLA